MPSYIHDGYNETAFIRGVPHLYGDVRFTFRPMLAEDRAEFVERGSKLKARDQTRRSAELIEHHVLEWNVERLDGKPVPITAEAILRLHPNLFNRILWVVTGTEPWDEDPGIEGQPRTSATLVEDQKN